MRAALKTIYIDESGNTGSNLLDKDQPVFATASCDFSLAEAEYLLSHLPSSATAEATKTIKLWHKRVEQSLKKREIPLTV